GDHTHQRLLGAAAWLQEAGEVATGPQLRHVEVQRPEARVPGAQPIPVAVGRALAAALIASGTDLRPDLRVHHFLHQPAHCLPEPVLTGARLRALAQRLHHRHPNVGHRVLLRARLTHRMDGTRWPCRLRRLYTTSRDSITSVTEDYIADNICNRPGC